MVYIPFSTTVKIRKPFGVKPYSASWFDPATNVYSEGKLIDDGGILITTSQKVGDMVLILKSDRLMPDA